VKDINIEDLTFAYSNKIEVLHHISLAVESGESVGLIGANGAGKSTLLKLLVGLAEGYQGSIALGGLRVEKKNLARIRAKAGYVFQDSESQLFLSTVYEDVAFGPRNYGLAEEEVDGRVMEALRKMHIEDLKDRQIYRMSGGQKKLASIATILSLEPKVMLLDEPTIALDPRNRRTLIHILNEIRETKVIATHDLDMVWDTCERTVLISAGRVRKDGKTREILRDKELLEANGLELPLGMQRL
jgi:cobalt/nickel transport system ATP-binding protein